MDIEVKIPSPNEPTTETASASCRPLNRRSMIQVSCDDFTCELAAEPGVHGQVVRTIVRAFLAAALRGFNVRTRDGWRSVIQDMRYVLGSALSEGVEQVRPVSHGKLRQAPIHIRPSAPPRASVSRDPLIPNFPTLRDNEAALDYQGLLVHLVHALVRAYVAARMTNEEGATPEGRSRILGQARELVWDGILDAVKQVPCPPFPRESARPPRRSLPERGR